MDEQTESPWLILDDLGERIRAQREEAERAGDEAAIVRFRAMEAVVDARVIAVICPDAVVVAGEAAGAAYEGHSEPEWYAGAFGRRRGSSEDQRELNTAVRLLRSARLWPWARSA